MSIYVPEVPCRAFGSLGCIVLFGISIPKSGIASSSLCLGAAEGTISGLLLTFNRVQRWLFLLEKLVLVLGVVVHSNSLNSAVGVFSAGHQIYDDAVLTSILYDANDYSSDYDDSIQSESTEAAFRVIISS